MHPSPGLVGKLPQDGTGILFEPIPCVLNISPLENIPELLVSFLTPRAEIGVFEGNPSRPAGVEESVEGIPLRFGVVFEHWCARVAWSGTGVDMAAVEVGVLHASGWGVWGGTATLGFLSGLSFRR